MQMTPEEVDSCINRIAWGKRYITAKDAEGEEHTLIVGALSLRFKALVEHKYNQSIKAAISEGIMTEAEMLKELGDKGVWTKEDDEKIKYLEAELEKINNSQMLESSTKRAKQKFEKLKLSISNHINELKTRRINALDNSAERLAYENKIRAYIYAVIEDENEQRFWKTWKEFEDYPDNKMIDSIAGALTSDKDIDSKKIRYIARNPIWRYKWSANKSTNNLFNRSTTELTDEQNALIYWSQLYDSVYDAYERPPNSVIEDDDALDAWLSEQSEKMEKETAKRDITKKSGGISSKVMNHGEVFVATPDNMIKTQEGRGWGGGNKDAEGFSREQISSLNDPLAKKFLSIQEERIKRAGVIEERDLRGDSDSRRVIGSSDAVVSKKKRRDGYTGKHVDKLLPGGTLKGHRA